MRAKPITCLAIARRLLKLQFLRNKFGLRRILPNAPTCVAYADGWRGCSDFLSYCSGMVRSEENGGRLFFNVDRTAIIIFCAPR
jgi:hypothetical protein